MLRKTKNNRKKKRITYPFSRRRVYFSGLLCFLSLLFMLILSEGNISVIGLYLMTTGIIGVPSYLIKIHIYREKVEEIKSASRKDVRIWVTLFLFSLMLLCSPFVFLYLFGPHAWLIVINGFISGVNIPEIVIYLISCQRPASQAYL